MEATGKKILNALVAKDFERAEALIRSTQDVDAIIVDDGLLERHLIEVIVDRFERGLISQGPATRLAAMIIQRGGFDKTCRNEVCGLLPGFSLCTDQRLETRRANLAMGLIKKGIPQDAADLCLFLLLNQLKKRTKRVKSPRNVWRLMECLLEGGANPNASIEQSGWRCLMEYAAETRDDRAVALLHQYGGNLLVAAGGGYPISKALKLAKGSLSKLGREVPSDLATEYSGRSPLNLVLTWDTLRKRDRLHEVELLISAGADVNEMDEQGYRPLVRACVLGPDSKDTLAIVRALLDAGGNPNLLEKSTRAGDPAGLAAIHVACSKLAENIPESGSVRSRKSRPRKRSSGGNAWETQLALIDLLLETGADPDKRTRKSNGERTPLHVLLEAFNKKVSNTGRFARSSRRRAPGLDASPVQEAIEKFLGAGAEPNAKDARGRTPLCVLAAPQKWASETEDLIDAVLALGFDPGIKDDSGRSAFHFAVEHGAGRRLLRSLRKHTQVVVLKLSDALLTDGLEGMLRLWERSPRSRNAAAVQDALRSAVFLRDGPSAGWLLEKGADPAVTANTIRQSENRDDPQFPLWLLRFYAKLEGRPALAQFAEDALPDETRPSGKKLLGQIIAKVQGPKAAAEKQAKIEKAKTEERKRIRRLTRIFVNRVRDFFKDLRTQGVFAADIYNLGRSPWFHGVEEVVDKFYGLPEAEQPRFVDETGELRYCFTDTRWYREEAKEPYMTGKLVEPVTSVHLLYRGGNDEITMDIGEKICKTAPKHELEVEWDGDPETAIKVSLNRDIVG